MAAKMPVRITASRLLRQPVWFLAFGFGAGLAPIAPGTVGSLVAVPIYLALASAGLPLYGTVLVVLFVAGVWLCDQCEKQLGVRDHSGIVWDEIVGFLITMLGATDSWQTLWLGFGLFRLFDIVKPWPIRQIDRGVHGGLGIMLDDVMAACYALAGLLALRYFDVVA